MNYSNSIVEKLVGSEQSEIEYRPLIPFSNEAVNFLSELSSYLLKSTNARKYPDVIAFAYWCRKAHLNRLSANFQTEYQRIGRGLVFHIAPSNVPVNFAFSLAFGLLSGNANIVRIPSLRHPQITVICDAINDVFKLSEQNRIANMIRIISYPHQDEITAELSAKCHARVLWGGDATIFKLRSMRTSPRCIDICFADRYSICILGAKAITNANQKAFNSLIAGFYNDVFLLDQNACSSPHLIMWDGAEDEVRIAQNRFWPAMVNYLKNKPHVNQPIHSLDKYTQLCRTAIFLDEITAEMSEANLIYRVKLKHLPHDIENHRGSHGFFFEVVDYKLEDLESIVGLRYQTVTTFGVDPQKIIKQIVDSGLIGIDRVVPVGNALDIGVYWDGYDIIGTLSRVITHH
jgi:hypothetical protein